MQHLNSTEYSTPHNKPYNSTNIKRQPQISLSILIHLFFSDVKRTKNFPIKLLCVNVLRHLQMPQNILSCKKICSLESDRKKNFLMAAPSTKSVSMIRTFCSANFSSNTQSAFISAQGLAPSRWKHASGRNVIPSGDSIIVFPSLTQTAIDLLK
jgi:hypothetical protein